MLLELKPGDIPKRAVNPISGRMRPSKKYFSSDAVLGRQRFSYMGKKRFCQNHLKVTESSCFTSAVPISR